MRKKTQETTKKVIFFVAALTIAALVTWLIFLGRDIVEAKTGPGSADWHFALLLFYLFFEKFLDITKKYL